MRIAKKTIRHYIGLKRRWKIALAALAAVGIILGGLSLLFRSQPEPEPVLFNPLTAEKGVYCYFDAVGISAWLYKEKTENGSYTTIDTYFIAEDAGGHRIIADLDMETQTNVFSQQMYFSGGWLGDSAPKPYRLQGLAVPMQDGDKVRSKIAEALEIDDGEEYEEFFGSVILSAGKSPKKTGASKLEGYALFAGLAVVVVFFGNMDVLSMMWACFKDLKKYGKLEAAAEQVGKGHGDDPIIVGDGYVFQKNKGFALCPEMVKEATCSGTMVSLMTMLDSKPTVLHFCNVEQARRFMEFIPLECVRDDDVMIKTDSPEKYEYEY